MNRFHLAVYAFVTLCVLPACNPYSVAWRTLDGVQKARKLTAQQLASSAGVKRKDCLKQHGAKTEAYAECVKPTRAMLKHWQEEARPAVNSAIQLTATALQIAERVKKKPKIAWTELLLPAACALTRVVKSFGHYFKDKGKTVLAALSLFDSYACK